jgi:hypothetical protein
MSENNRPVEMNEDMGENNPAPEVEVADEELKEEREFSWYGGQVDETIVREIVRLKRQHKV